MCCREDDVRSVLYTHKRRAKFGPDGAKMKSPYRIQSGKRKLVLVPRVPLLMRLWVLIKPPTWFPSPPYHAYSTSGSDQRPPR